MQGITTAIRGRNLLAFNYDGSTRIVEPHAYGIDGKGHPALSAWQLNQAGDTGTSGWRLFHIDKMSGITTLAEKFSGTRPGYVHGGGQQFERAITTL